MKRLMYFIVAIILLSFISSCSIPKDDRGNPTPFAQNYKTYDSMIEDYKKINPNYNEIYLDPLLEFNPIQYGIFGICNCKNINDNSYSNNIFRCPNLIEAYPGIYYEDKYGNVCSLCCFYNVEDIVVDELEFSGYKQGIKWEKIDTPIHPALTSNYVYYNDIPIFSSDINDIEILELLKENLKKHYNL